MRFGQCRVCNGAEAKYKCPTCSLVYCSLICFKDVRHSHDEVSKAPPTIAEEKKNDKDEHKQQHEDKYTTLFKNERLQYLLKFKALQIHLYSIFQILNDARLTQDNKMDLANEKLNSLRIAGAQENELVEEFCGVVIDILQS